MILAPFECWAVCRAIDRHKLTIDSGLVQQRPRFVEDCTLGVLKFFFKKAEEEEEALTSKRLFLNVF